MLFSLFFVPCDTLCHILGSIREINLKSINPVICLYVIISFQPNAQKNRTICICFYLSFFYLIPRLIIGQVTFRWNKFCSHSYIYSYTYFLLYSQSCYNTKCGYFIFFSGLTTRKKMVITFGNKQLCIPYSVHQYTWHHSSA